MLGSYKFCSNVLQYFAGALSMIWAARILLSLIGNSAGIIERGFNSPSQWDGCAADVFVTPWQVSALAL
jgi:hypothetical protein